jgi:radical SAM protein with 4Fe4S-binding SPASM domain
MTFNVHAIDEIITLADAVGAAYQFDPTVKPKMNGDRGPLEYAVPPETLRRLVLNRPELYKAFRRLEPQSLCDGNSGLFTDENILCGAARSFISISADGGVYACGFFARPGGHLKEQTLKDIWFGSQQFNQIRATTFGKMTACAKCDVKSTCSPCMAYSDNEHGDHTQCATSSRQLAQAVHLLAWRRVAANRKLATGRSLPLVGNTVFTPLDAGAEVAPLSTE